MHEGVNLAAMADFQVLIFLISLTILDCCHAFIKSLIIIIKRLITSKKYDEYLNKQKQRKIR